MIVRKLLLSALSVTITLLVAEAGFRFAAVRNDLRTLQQADLTERPEPGSSVRWSDMIRLHRNPGIIYSLHPDLSVRFLNQPVTINAQGFRGKDIPVAKPPETLRIVGLGDSVMFGWGVGDEETFLALLSQKLNQAFPTCTWDVINTAVPGYNTAMEVETLREVGLNYTPDLVILSFIGNDFNLPNFIREQENVFSVTESFLLKHLNGTLRQVRLKKSPRSLEGGGFESDPQVAPEPYRNMVGVSGFERAMRDLQTLSREHHFNVVVLVAHTLPEVVETLSRELGFDLLHVQPVWYQIAEENNLDPVSDWRRSPKDPHPSALGHQVIAEVLFTYLEGSALSCE